MVEESHLTKILSYTDHPSVAQERLYTFIFILKVWGYMLIFYMECTIISVCSDFI